MIDSKILASIIIVACIGVAAAGYQMTQSEAPLWDPSSTQDVQTDDSSQTDDIQTDDSQSDNIKDTQESGSNTKSGSSDSGNSKKSNSNGNGNGNSNGNGGSGSNSGTNTHNGGTNSNQKKSDSSGISSSQAKSIANKNIEVAGAYAGSPKKTTLDGKSVYYVPIINKGGNVTGYFYIDMNGKIIEGAGGA